MSESDTRLAAPARYFPVAPRAYRMEAGLSRLGTDFGNGAVDALFFQVDRERQRYLAAKRAVGTARHGMVERGADDRDLHAAVREWMRETLAVEHPEIDPGGGDYAALAARLQEDFALLHQSASGGSEMLALYVSLPSGWRPERVLGASFEQVHGPVPDFAESAPAVDSMVRAMVERGPYVRFVWTVSADDLLDHHPDAPGRVAWPDTSAGWLRVERQVTVPFARWNAALFLIRVYLYPFAALNVAQCADLTTALELMPGAVRRYKGLDGVARQRALELLRR